MIDNLVWKSNRELSQVRKESLSVMEYQANRQIIALQEQANLLVKQAQEIENRVKLAYSIEESIYNFEPVTMREYSLYEHKGNLVLTLIEPFNSSPYDKFLTTVRKLGDSTWEEVPPPQENEMNNEIENEDDFDSENLPDGTVIDSDGYTTCDKCGGEALLIEQSHMEDGRECMDWGVTTCENEGCLHVHEENYE